MSAVAHICFVLSSLHGCTALPFTNAWGPHPASESIAERHRRQKKTQRLVWATVLVSFIIRWDQHMSRKVWNSEMVEKKRSGGREKFRQSSQMDQLKKCRGNGSRTGCSGQWRKGMDSAWEEKKQIKLNPRELLLVHGWAWNSNSSWTDLPAQTLRCHKLSSSHFELPSGGGHPEPLKKVPSPKESTYLIVERGVCAFLYCRLLLLITYYNDHHRVNVLTHQLPGLDDSDGNLWGTRTPHKLQGSGPACLGDVTGT